MSISKKEKNEAIHIKNLSVDLVIDGTIAMLFIENKGNIVELARYDSLHPIDKIVIENLLDKSKKRNKKCRFLKIRRKNARTKVRLSYR